MARRGMRGGRTLGGEAITGRRYSPIIGYRPAALRGGAYNDPPSLRAPTEEPIDQ